MFKKSRIRQEIDNLIDSMSGMEPESAEYRRCAENLKLLTEAYDTQSNVKSKVIETVVVSSTNLAGIIFIANYERFGVWTTKAFSQVLKR